MILAPQFPTILLRPFRIRCPTLILFLRLFCLLLFSISRAKLLSFVQRAAGRIAWISKLRVEKWRRKGRGTMGVRKAYRDSLDFEVTLCVLFYELSKLGERGIRVRVLAQPSREGLWRLSWQTRVISKSYRGTWMVLINRSKLYSSKSSNHFSKRRREIIHSYFFFKYVFFKLNRTPSTRGCEISKSLVFALEERREGDCRRVIHRRKKEGRRRKSFRFILYSLIHLRLSVRHPSRLLLLRPSMIFFIPWPPRYSKRVHSWSTPSRCKGHPLKRKNIGGREKKSQSDYYPLLSFLSFFFSFSSSSSPSSASSGFLRKSKYRLGHPRLRALYFTPIHSSANRGKYRRIVGHAGN